MYAKGTLCIDANDFYLDTLEFTNGEVGQLIRMLILIQQKEGIPDDEMRLLVGPITDRVLNKFEIDSDGCFVNRRYVYTAKAMRKRCKSDAGTDMKEDDIKPTWKTDFKIYEKEVSDAFDRLIADKDWIAQRKRYHPGLDILKTIEKAFNDFWGQEAGWQHKKKKRIRKIDWTRTFNAAIAQKTNQVWERKFDGQKNYK